MRLYGYECLAECPDARWNEIEAMRAVEDRHSGPRCPWCNSPTQLKVYPVRGLVKNPAVPRGR